MNIKKHLFVAILGVIAFCFGCKKSENNSASQTITDEQIKVGKTITKEEPARSQKKYGEFESDGETVSSPSNYNNSSNLQTQVKLEILTSSSSNQTRLLGNGKSGWMNTAFTCFFNNNGTYIRFDFSNKKWSWGFYYINKTLTYIVIDPGTTSELKWKINMLDASMLSVLENNTSITFQKQILQDFEFIPYTQDEFFSQVKSKNLYISSYEPSLEICDLTTTTYLQFFDLGKGANLENNEQKENWTWKVSEGKLIINPNTSNEQIFTIDFIDHDQLGLSTYEDGAINQLYLMSLTNYSVIYKNELLAIQNNTYDCNNRNEVVCDFSSSTANSLLDLSAECQLFDQIWGLEANSVKIGGSLNFSTTPGVGWAKKFGDQFVTSFSLAGAKSEQYITSTNNSSVTVYGPENAIFEIWNLETMTTVATDTFSVTFTALPNTRYGGFAWYSDNKQAEIEINSSLSTIE